MVDKEAKHCLSHRDLLLRVAVGTFRFTHLSCLIVKAKDCGRSMRLAFLTTPQFEALAGSVHIDLVPKLCRGSEPSTSKRLLGIVQSLAVGTIVYGL